VAQPQTKPASVYDWPTSIAFAVAGTVVAVVLIVIFENLIDWVGDFWSQVIYFVAIFGGILLAARRSRASDTREPSRLSRGAPPITPAGLPGPFVVTQGLGVLGVTMLVAAVIIGGDRGLLWGFSGFVLVLVGGVGLVFWTAGIVSARRRAS
jgi:hypothetical protein